MQIFSAIFLVPLTVRFFLRSTCSFLASPMNRYLGDVVENKTDVALVPYGVYILLWVFLFGAFLLCDLNGKYAIRSWILPLFTENASSRV